MKITLGEVGTYINGYAFKPSDWGASGLPIIRIQNLTNQNTIPNYFDGPYNSKFEVNKGDILIAWSGSLGIHVWQKNKALLNQHIFRVEFDKCDIDKMYFYYAVKHNIHKMLHLTHGATMRHIIKSDFEQIVIPYPSLDIQAKISKILNYLEQNIINYRAILSKLDLLIKSRFVELFGDIDCNTKNWPIITLENLAELITDGEHSTPKRSNEGIYLLSARNILNHSLKLDDVDYIDENEYSRISKRVIPKAGDILLSCSGSVGRCCVVPLEIKFQLVRSVALIRFKSEITPIFAEYMITSDWFQRQINSLKTASSQANLFQGRIKKLKGFVPDINLQYEFIKVVNQINKLKFD